MLRRLRLQVVAFIAIVTGVAFTLAFAFLVATNYHSAYEDVHHALKRATEVGPAGAATFTVGVTRREGFVLRADMQKPSDEPFGNTPTAVYIVDEAGSIVSSNEVFVAMDEDCRDLAIAQALASDEPEGHVSEAGVFYYKTHVDDTVIIAFADSAAFTNIMMQSTRSAFIAFVALWVAMVCLSILLSRVITRPVENAWKQQKDFIANASHELKTPLTVLMANNDIMMSHPEFTAAQRQTWLEGNKAEAEHMRGLVEDMLTLARNEQMDGSEQRSFEEVDLSGLVERAALAFDAVAFEAGVQTAAEVSPGITVTGDSQSLERLVKTLIDNAVKYAGVGGSVTVSLGEPRKGHPQLSVNNTGACMSSEEIEHVFDRFWRSDSARSRSSNGGYGLGLAIAKSIADAHRAQITVTSNESSGTTFTVVF